MNAGLTKDAGLGDPPQVSPPPTPVGWRECLSQLGKHDLGFVTTNINISGGGGSDAYFERPRDSPVSVPLVLST